MPIPDAQAASSAQYRRGAAPHHAAARAHRRHLPEGGPDRSRAGRRALRAAIEQRWGLDGKEAALTGRLKDLQEILETKATLDTQGMATLIGIVAIPNFVVALMALYVGVIDHVSGGAEMPNVASYGLIATGAVMVVSVIFLAVAYLLTRKRN